MGTNNLPRASQLPSLEAGLVSSHTASSLLSLWSLWNRLEHMAPAEPLAWGLQSPLKSPPPVFSLSMNVCSLQAESHRLPL